MMRLFLFIFFVITNVFLANAQFSYQANVEARIHLNSIALLDIEPNNFPFLLDLKNTIEAGQKIYSRRDSTKWINYTSALKPSTSHRSLSAHICSRVIPSGTALFLEASSYMGHGKGQFGRSNGTVQLANYPQNIINNIGGSYSGTGVGNGYQLLYYLEITNYSLLDFEDANTLTIVYTLTDD